MDEPVITTPKKTIRTRKTASESVSQTLESSPSVVPSATKSTIPSRVFDDLLIKLTQAKVEFENLQKEISQTKEEWDREKKQNEVELNHQKTQEEVERKREQETYQYNISLSRKRAEDEFLDKKNSWEKDLSQRKQELEDQRKELEELRKQVFGFDSQKEQAVKDAESLLEKQLIEKFNQEKTLREQVIKSEKEVFGLKTANLEVDNSRLNKEIEILKKSLDEASRQVKEIAVKVIESGSQSKSQISPQE